MFNKVKIDIPSGLPPGRYVGHINEDDEFVIDGPLSIELYIDMRPCFDDAPYSPPNPVQCNHSHTKWNLGFSSGDCMVCGLRFSRFEDWRKPPRWVTHQYR